MKVYKAFQKGEDIHAATVAKVYQASLEEVNREQRSHAKMVKFELFMAFQFLSLGVLRHQTNRSERNY